jgi:hypothetical protein
VARDNSFRFAGSSAMTSGGARGRRISRGAAVFAGIVAAGLIVRRLGRRSGASRAEVLASLPGDALVSEPMWQSTRAVTIDAPPAAVWPWIVQMGYPAFRAGWYTPYWLDRLQWGIRERSADRIIDELQTLSVGDRVPDSPDWSVFFTVAELERERALVLRSTRHLLPPMRSIDFSWAFVVRPLSGHRTRFLVRARARYAPRWSWLVLGAPYSLGDWLNTSNILRAVKHRAEKQAIALPPLPTRVTPPCHRQPVATHGNAFGLFGPFSRPLHLPPIATSCDRSAP